MVPSTPLKLIILGAFATLARAGGVQLETIDGRPHCTVVANEDDQNDVPHIREAFEKCGQSGTIVFPEDQEYYIAERLNPRVKDVQIEWRGQWTVCLYTSISPPFVFASLYIGDCDSVG